MFELLKKLCETPGVSGDESRVRNILLGEIGAYADCKADALGNLLVFKKGAARAKTRLMLSAHMDEVGLIAACPTDTGFWHFDAVGGIDPRVILGRRVVFANGVRGVVGTKAVHLQTADERGAAPGIDKLLLDIGARSKEEALKFLSPGDVAVFDSRYIPFGDGLIKARAIDDRVGCAILTELIRSDLPFDCCFAFTVQEEVGTRGAGTAAFSVKPDAALVIEATTAADIAGVADDKRVCFLGRGPVLSFMDRRTVYDRGLYRLAFETAGRSRIPCQAKQGVAGGNDAGAIHLANGGVKTLAVSLPCRYLHSPFCVIRRDDAENTLRLVRALIPAIAGS